MITSEADSNNEQIQASANMFLKARQESCDRINHLYPELNLSVKLRVDIIEEFERNISREGDDGGDIHNGTTNPD